MLWSEAVLGSLEHLHLLFDHNNISSQFPHKSEKLLKSLCHHCVTLDESLHPPEPQLGTVNQSCRVASWFRSLVCSVTHRARSPEKTNNTTPVNVSYGHTGIPCHQCALADEKIPLRTLDLPSSASSSQNLCVSGCKATVQKTFIDHHRYISKAFDFLAQVFRYSSGIFSPYLSPMQPWN